jgi:NAD(P)-dependent dehydrogenase (short-subunit alcohol dehydrogenase family)
MRSLVERGWTVIGDARRAGELAATAIEAGGAGTVVAVPGDVADPDHRAQLVAAAERIGRLDLLVNNASTLGESPLPRLDALSVDTYRRILDVNVVAPLALTQTLLPLLRASGGRIINVTSDAAAEGYETWGGYGSSKAALEQLSNVLAVEEPDVRVYRVDPGDMRTEMHQDAFPGEDISDRPLPEASALALVELALGDQPSGRYRAAELVTS